MKGIVPSKILERHTKSDLSFFSKKEVMNLDTHNLISRINKICNGLYKKEFLEKRLKNKSIDFTEIYQILEFTEWLERNKFYLNK